MDPEVEAVLGRVLRDLAVSGYPAQVGEPWTWSADPTWPSDPALPPPRVVEVRFPDGGGRGVLVGAPGEPVDPEVVCAAVHGLQDDVVDDVCWARGTPRLWPEYPTHPATHPLTPRVQDGEVVWCCLRTGEVVHRLGELPATPGPRR